MTATEKIRDKSFYHRQTSERMDQHLMTPSWSMREKLALTCRILDDEKHESALAGQITTRADEPGTYWMLSFGLGFDEAQKSNIVRVDDDLNIVEGEGMPNPANRFHLWIYRHRPQVNAIVHTHPPHVAALSMLGVPLNAPHMDTSMFYEDCAWMPEYPGVPIGDEEGRLIHEALGTKRAILLGHHGQLAACPTIEEATMLAIFIERAAKLQLMASAAGTIREVKPECIREAHDYRLKKTYVDAVYCYYARRVLRKSTEVLE
ncbi:MAG: aldolase [Betaproteobacteria bacterium]